MGISLEKEETKQKEQPTKNHSYSLLGAIVIFMFILSGTAFWWAPRFFPHLFVQKTEPAEKKEKTNHFIAELKQESAELKSEFLQLKEQLRIIEQKPPQSLPTINTPLLFTFMDLKIAIKLGIPYTTALERFKKQTSESTIPLDDYAEFGVPTLPFLISQLKACIDEISNIPPQQTPQTRWEKVIDKLHSLIKIKKIEQEGIETTDVWGLHPLLLLAKRGEIASVLLQLNQKTLPASTCLDTWKTHAEAYVKVEKRLDELMQTFFVNPQK